MRQERREALESYEDELFEELVLQAILLEQKVIESIKDILYPELDIRPRDLIKAKVKYLMDPEQNAKYEGELNTLRDSLTAAQNQKSK